MRYCTFFLLFILSKPLMAQFMMPAYQGLQYRASAGGTIVLTPPTGGNALCDATHQTAIVPITSSTGSVWMDRNLGASRAATSDTDFEAYGCLYQWGRGNDGHASIIWSDSTTGTPVNGSTATLATTDNPGNALFITTSAAPNDWRSNNNNTRWQGLAGTNNPCPSGYRIPTDAEFAAESYAYGITNDVTAYANGPGGGFKFLRAGSRNASSSLGGTGSAGRYWSSSISGSISGSQTFSTSGLFTNGNVRVQGFSVRCIKDPTSLAICDGSAPTPVVPIVSSTGRTWMDRNLGASRAATSATDFEAYGCLYQWGRGNDGHASIAWTSSSTGTPLNGTTTTQSSTDNPGNPLFVTNGTDWRSTKNDALWQGAAGTNNPCPALYRLPTDAEYYNEISANGFIDISTAYGSIFKFPASGLRNALDGVNLFIGVRGFYWTSTTYNSSANYRGFNPSSISGGGDTRTDAFPVRCIKDVSVQTGSLAICDGYTQTALVPITSPSGRVWMDRNLGASRAATSATDQNAYGCLYQWGRGNDGHASINWTSSSTGTPVNGTTITQSSTDNPGNALFVIDSPDWRSTTNNTLWQGLVGKNNPCLTGYRLPTAAEFSVELGANSITNSATAYSSIFKFTLSGARASSNNGNPASSTSSGFYWSSTISSLSAKALGIDSGSVDSNFIYGRAGGFAVRCIKE